MNNNEYILNEIETAERGHDSEYNISVQFKGTKRNSRNVDLTKEQLNKIKEIFKE